MNAMLRPPSEKQVGVENVTVDLMVEYLAGGGASKLPVQFRHQQTPQGSASFPDFEDFVFGNGAVPEESKSTPPGELALVKQALTLDGAGSGRVVASGLKKMETPSRIALELEYRDPSGEVQTASSSVMVYPSKTLVGIKADSWFASKKSLKFTLAVVDLEGHPVANAPVEAELLEKKTYSHRKKLVGGFYAYENRSELKKLGKACAGSTDVPMACSFAIPSRRLRAI